MTAQLITQQNPFYHINNFEQVSHIAVMYLLLTLKLSFPCWRSTPTEKYMFKVIDRSTRSICTMLTILLCLSTLMKRFYVLSLDTRRKLNVQKASRRRPRLLMMMNCFCGMLDRRKAFSLISSRDHCQRSSSSQICDTPQAGFEPAQNMNSGLVEWRCAVVIPQRHMNVNILNVLCAFNLRLVSRR